jgi:CARDB
MKKFKLVAALSVAATTLIALTAHAQPSGATISDFKPPKYQIQGSPAAQAALPKLPGGLPVIKPDLSVMSMQPRMLGAAPYLYVCVKNQGPGNAGAFDVQVSMGAPAPTGSPPISWIRLVGVIRYSAMASGVVACNDFLIGGTALPNCVKYTASVDIKNEVAETNETNNTREHLGQCLIEPPHPASIPKLNVPKLPVYKPDLQPIPGPNPKF